MTTVSELRKLREAIYDLATDDELGDELSDEAWYNRLWTLLDPVIDARAERQLAAAVNAVADETRDAARCPVTWNPGVWPYTTRCVETVYHGVKHVDRHGNTFLEEQLPTHDAGEYRDPSTGEVDVEAHRFTFEGSTTLLARHLVDEHDVLPGTVEPFASGVSQGAWVALDNLHREAHEH